MEGRPWKYVRPDDGGIAPTPHVLLAGSADDIRALSDSLIALGATHITDPAPPHHSHRFASFAAAPTAAAAVAALAASHPAVVPKYAGVRPSKAPSTSPPPDAEPAALTAEACGIPGLRLLPDFVTAEEEAALLAEVDALPWVAMARRRVQHYGHPFDYAGRTVDRGSGAAALPPRAAALLAPRLAALPDVGPLDQLTVNEYPAGVGIGPHVETHSAFGAAIAALSLAGPAAMVFRRGGEQRAIFLPPRSLLIMAGEARLAWAHYVPHRKADPVAGRAAPAPRAPRRVSYTFRLVRQGPCACAFPALCDSQDGSIPPTRASLAAAAAAEGSAEGPPEGRDPEKAAQELEDTNVRDVYDAIAPHFSATRFSVWPAVRRFADAWPPGAIVADVGCGNGKYFSLRHDAFTAGSDRSAGLAAVAARRLAAGPSLRAPRADVVVADGLRLPYRPGSCDAALCIAVLHHLASPERRVALLAALRDLLAPGGRALVTVWATEQENTKKMAKWEAVGTETGDNGGTGGEGRDCLVPWHLPLHRAEAAAAAAAGADKALDSEKNALVFRRYYHLFDPGELEGLVARVPGAAVVEAFYDKDNWCVVMERTAGGQGG